MTKPPKPPKSPKRFLADNDIVVMSGDDLRSELEVADGVYKQISLEEKEQAHREIISSKITNTFIFLNFLIYVLVLIMYCFDVYFKLNEKEPLGIIDTKTVLTLIGATTVQLGALMIAMGKWLFPTNAK